MASVGFRSQSGDDSEENLITLCADCHSLLHQLDFRTRNMAINMSWGFLSQFTSPGSPIPPNDSIDACAACKSQPYFSHFPGTGPES
jgi:HNH endonuclease